MPYRRRRHIFGRATKSPKPPKPPKAPKEPRPKVRELRGIYKGLVTADESQMITMLSYAMQWYDGALKYVTFKTTGQFTQQQTDDYKRALNCRQRGVSTTFMGEKITSFRLALKNYEKVVRSVGLKVPRIDKYLVIADAKQKDLQELERRLMLKYSTVLDIMTKAFAPINGVGAPVTLKVGTITEPYLLDSEAAVISLRKDTVKHLYKVLRREGLMPLLREVADPFSRIAALELERDLNQNLTGRKLMRFPKQTAAILRLFDNLIAFGQTQDAPKRLVKPPRAVVPLAPGQVAVPKVKGGTGRTFGKREVTFGNYRIGCAGAKLVEALLDYQAHESADLEKVVFPSSLKDRLRSLTIRGGKYGLWSIAYEGTKVKMVPTDALTQARQPKDKTT